MRESECQRDRQKDPCLEMELLRMKGQKEKAKTRIKNKGSKSTNNNSEWNHPETGNTKVGTKLEKSHPFGI